MQDVNRIELTGWIADVRSVEVKTENGPNTFASATLVIRHPIRPYVVCYLKLSAIKEARDTLLKLQDGDYIKVIGKFGYNYNRASGRKFYNVFTSQIEVLPPRPFPTPKTSRRVEEPSIPEVEDSSQEAPF